MASVFSVEDEGPSGAAAVRGGWTGHSRQARGVGAGAAGETADS